MEIRAELATKAKGSVAAAGSGGGRGEEGARLYWAREESEGRLYSDGKKEHGKAESEMGRAEEGVKPLDPRKGEGSAPTNNK